LDELLMKRLLQYQYKDINFEYDGLTDEEKAIMTEEQFNQLLIEHDLREGEQTFFPITSLSKSDIRGRMEEKFGANSEEYKKTCKVLDQMGKLEMKHLARKMADDYCNQLYWSSLEILFEQYYLDEN